MTAYANRLVTTVSAVASAGLGAFTISTASSSYRTFVAGDDGKTFDVSIVEGTAWEVRTGCVYTHSGTSLARGTLEASSTEAAIAFGTGAVLTVTPSADTFRRFDAAALQHVAGTDANTTMAVDNLYVVPMSAWATADRTYTLPATAAVGSRIGIMVTSGNASYELIIKPSASDTINGGVAAAEWSRLFITGEVVIFRCVTADSAWVVEYDGRIPMHSVVSGIFTSTASGSAQTLSYTGTEEIVNVGQVSTNSNERMFTARRACNVNIQAFFQATFSASAKYLQAVISYSGGGTLIPTIWTPTGGSQNTGGSDTKTLAVDAYFTATIEQNDSTSEDVTYRVSAKEEL